MNFGLLLIYQTLLRTLSEDHILVIKRSLDGDQICIYI